MCVARKPCGCALAAVLDEQAHPEAVASMVRELDEGSIEYTLHHEERESIGREPCARHAPDGWSGPIAAAVGP